MYYGEALPSEYQPGVSGILDDLAKIVGGGAKILDKIRTGGTVTISPPGGQAVELDTRDPAFFEKVRQVGETLKNAAGGLIQFKPNQPGSGYGTPDLFSRAGQFATSPGGMVALAIGGGLLLLLLTSKRRG